MALVADRLALVAGGLEPVALELARYPLGLLARCGRWAGAGAGRWRRWALARCRWALSGLARPTGEVSANQLFGQ